MHPTNCPACQEPRLDRRGRRYIYPVPDGLLARQVLPHEGVIVCFECAPEAVRLQIEQGLVELPRPSPFEDQI